MHSWLILLFLALPMTALGNDTGSNTIELKIGVRKDAVSMSYFIANPLSERSNLILGPLRKAGYSGYMAYICDRVLIEMQRQFGSTLSVTTVPVLAKDRFSKLTGNSGYHILCDPTTVTKQRLDGLISSPPLFVTGTSFIKHTAGYPQMPCNHLVGMVGTNDRQQYRGLKAVLRKGELFPYGGAVESFLDDDQNLYEKNFSTCTNEKGVNTTRLAPVRLYDSHTEAAADFCKGATAIYIGDKEIISQAVKNIAGCDFEKSNKTYTEDRYVILGKISRQHLDDDADFMVSRFFGILSQMIFFKPSILDEAFEVVFSSSKKSKKLEQLYWGLRG